jgi:hypothetical protein
VIPLFGVSGRGYSPQVPTSGQTDVRPPNNPWVRLPTVEPEVGCLSFYLSDELASVPVRAVTLPGNNKSDPNLETGTYGLFSTCEQQMRTSVVRRGLSYLFFVTRWQGERHLTGQYRLNWYSEGTFGHDSLPDYALAAESIRFVNPIPMASLARSVGERLADPFRTFRLLDAPETRAINRLLTRSPDRSDAYLSEIDRLERFNLHFVGYRCWARKEPFSWSVAREYLLPDPGRLWATSHEVSNASATGHWICAACGAVLMNQALLKQCQACGAFGSLRPALLEEVPR